MMFQRIPIFIALLTLFPIQGRSQTRPSDDVPHWPQFRGQNSAGVGAGSPPIRFDPHTNVRWSVGLEAGHSSPCIVGSKLFVTTYSETNSQVSVVGLDRATGEQLWERSFEVDRFEKGHPSFNPASSSPCCDPECVVAYFGSYGLVCLDHRGNLIWDKQLPLTKSYAGNATSPIITDGKVVLYRGNYVDHYLLCLDKHTGEELWRVPQSEEFTGEMACTAVPIVVDEKLICHSARAVQAFHIETGERLWIAKAATTATSTPVLIGDEVFVAAWNKLGEPDLRPPFPSFEQLVAEQDQNQSGTLDKAEFPRLWIFHRPAGAEAPQNGAPVSFRRADKNGNGEIEMLEWELVVSELEKFRAGYDTHGLIAIPVESQGLVSAESVRVLTTRGIPEVPSPVADGQRVYMVKNGGQLTCLDAKTGEVAHRIRTGGTGTHYASPLIACGRLYTFSGAGQVSVIQLGESLKVLSVNDMEEKVYATPAIVDGVIYLRTHTRLYAFESKN